MAVLSTSLKKIVQSRADQGQLKIIKNMALWEATLKSRGPQEENQMELLNALDPLLTVPLTAVSLDRQSSRLFFVFQGTEEEVIAKIDAIPVKKWNTPRKKVVEMIAKQIVAFDDDCEQRRRSYREAVRLSKVQGNRVSHWAKDVPELKREDLDDLEEFGREYNVYSSTPVTKLRKLRARNDVTDSHVDEAFEEARNTILARSIMAS